MSGKSFPQAGQRLPENVVSGLCRWPSRGAGEGIRKGEFPDKSQRVLGLRLFRVVARATRS